MSYKYETTQEVRDVQRLVSVTCNCCGKTATPDADPNKCNWDGGFHNWRFSGGFDDEFPWDLEVFDIVACDDCLEAWVKTFKDPRISLVDDELLTPLTWRTRDA